MAYQTIPPSSSGGASNTIAYWASVGMGRLNLTANQVAIDASDFLETASASNVWWTVAGTVTNPTNVKGGVVQMNTAGSSDIIRPSTWGPLARATTPFYFYTRFKFASVPTVANLGLAGFADAVATQQGFFIGGAGTSFPGQDGVHYGVLTWDGVTQTGYLSSVTMDTSWHDCEVWYDGIAFKFAVDNESPITIAGNLPSSSVFLYPFFLGAGARTYQWDTFVALSSRE